MNARLLLIILALLPMASAASQPVGRLDVEYLNGAEWSGRIEAACQVAGIRFHQGAGALHLIHDGATVTIHRVWTNDSFTSAGWRQLDGREVATEIQLDAGTLDVAWPEDGRAFIKSEPPGNPAMATLAARRAVFDPFESIVSVSTHYPVGHVSSDPTRPGTATFKPMGFGGPSARIRTDEATTVATGGMTAMMDGATMSLEDGDHISLPTFRELVSFSGVPGVATIENYVYTYATLEIRHGSVRVDATRSDLFCSEVRGEITGGIAFRTAQGTFNDRGHNLSFGPRELAVAGDFHFVEEGKRSESEGGPVVSDFRAVGDFSAISLDYTIVPAPAPAKSIVPVALATILLGILIAVGTQFSRFVGLFYTRFHESTALRHPTRAMLMQMTADKPGFILKDVVTTTGRPYSVVRHHTRILETVGLVKTLRIGHALHVYPAKASLVEGRKQLMLEHDEPAKFVIELIRTGVTDAAELRRQVGIQFLLTRMGAWKVVKRVETAGFLRPTPTASS